MELRTDSQKAKQVFRTVCDMIEHKNWSHKKDEEKRQVQILLRGKCEPIPIMFTVDEEPPLLMVKAEVSVRIKEERRADAAQAICAINNTLVNGLFDYDLCSGEVIFRISNSHMDIDISEDTVFDLLLCTVRSVDEHTQELVRINNGELSAAELIRQISG